MLEDISFIAREGEKKYVIDADYVNEHLGKATEDDDLNIFGFAAGTSLHKDDEAK